jgi:FkbM family methyltransferase
MSQRRVPLGGGATAVVRAEPHGAFWDVVAGGRYEPAITALVAERAGPGTTFVDIGAWIGCYTLLAAGQGANVIAYEPDPVALVELQGNLALNPAALRGTVSVRPVALARRGGSAALVGGEHGLGSSLSRLAPHKIRDAELLDRVPVVAVDARQVGADPAVRAAALVKIDIEGAEYAVVPRLVAGLGGARPVLLVSLHGFDLRAWADGPGGAARKRVRRLAARLRGARRKARLSWSLRRYRLSLLDSSGSRTPLTGARLVGFCLRLAEADLLASPR